MTYFNNILVVLNDPMDAAQNPALARGAALAKKYRARLTLMDVIHIPDYAIHQYRGIIEPKELTDTLLKKRQQELQRAAATIDKSIEVSLKIANGRDFIEIIRQMVFAGHDLLIKVANSHCRRFDSSDFHIMRKCPKPVWLLRSTDYVECRKILAAIDLALEETAEGRALNTSIMNLATSLAQWQNCQLDVLSCWSLYGENSLRHSGFLRVSDEAFTRLIQEEQEHNQSCLDALVGRYAANQAINAHLIKGDPVDCIPAFTDANAIDTVIMGTVGRTGVPGLLIGNTSETVLQAIKSSVITLKPAGFESPVK